MKIEIPEVRFAVGPSGRRIAFSTNGRGPTLVCPPAWLTHLEENWQQPEFRAFFEHLGEVVTVVRYDRPGFGLSDPDSGESSLEEEVGHLEAILDAVGAERVSLLGFSSGGPPAIAFAAANPERVERLLLYGTYARGEELAPPDLRAALVDLVRAHWGAGARALSDVFIPDATSAQRERFARLQREAATAEVAERFLRLTYEMNVEAELSSIVAPTIVVHRRGDRAIAFEAGRKLAAAILGARFVPLPGRMHPAWMGDDDVAPVLSAFLRGREVAIRPSVECRLDAEARALVRDGETVPLTQLEFGVLTHLLHHADTVVSRERLIERVWKQTASGSNVVDAVIRTLRKKLGAWAPSIETVIGHGYRFRGFERSDL